METLRAAAIAAAGMAARSRPLTWLGALQQARPDDDERGQGLAEYALILSGIAVVAITSLVFLGSTIADLFWDPIDAEFGRILRDVIGIP